MKSTLYKSLLLISAATFLLSSCSSPMDNMVGEIGLSQDGAYHGESKIYFDQKNKADTIIHYSFGPNPIEVEKYEVKIPLRVLGDKSEQARSYKVSILKDKSTAEAGKHFTPLQDVYNFRAGEYTDTLRIEILRNELSADNNKPVTLSLSLEGTSDLPVAFEQQNHYTISFDNYLTEPSPWIYLTIIFGDYHRLKYIKLLEAYDHDENKFWEGYTTNFSEWILNVKSVRDYFLAHPELNVPRFGDLSTFLTFIE